MNGRARQRSRAVVFLVRGLDWADDRHRTSARCSVEEETNADLSAVYGAHDCTTALLSENCNLWASLSFFLCLALYVFLCHSLSLCLSLPLSVTLSVSLSQSLSASLCHSLSCSLCFVFSASLCHSLSTSLSLSLSLSCAPLSVSVCLYLSTQLPLPLYVSVHLYLCIFVWLLLCVAVCLSTYSSMSSTSNGNTSLPDTYRRYSVCNLCMYLYINMNNHIRCPSPC